MKKNLLLGVLIALSIGAVALHAQAVASQVVVQFVVIEHRVSELYLEDKGGARLLEAPLFEPSSPYEVTPVQGKLALVRYVEEKAPAKSSAGASSTAPAKKKIEVAEITVPETARQMLVLLEPIAGRDGKPTYRIATFASEAGDQNPKLKLINLSDRVIATDVGGEQLVLAKGERRVLDPKLDHKRRVVVQMAVQEGGAWSLIHRWAHQLKLRYSRTLVIVRSSTYAQYTGEKPERDASGKIIPQLVVIPWNEYLGPPAAPALAALTPSSGQAR